MTHTTKPKANPELRKARHDRDEVRYKSEEQAAWDELYSLDLTGDCFDLDLDFTNKGQNHGR